MIICPQCGNQNEEGSKFCNLCGSKLTESELEDTISFAPVEQEEEEIAIAPEAPEEGTLLVVKKGPNPGEKFPFFKEEIDLGRDPKSDIFLNDITVSRTHAKITQEGKSFFLSDLGSLNGTYLNSKRIEKEILKSGDEIQIGKFKLVFFSKTGP